MAYLDIATMTKDKTGTFARPMRWTNLVSWVKRGHRDNGPFTILLDLHEIPDDRRYVQVTVDFEPEFSGHGQPLMRLSQMGNPVGLIPATILEGPEADYTIEQWRNEAGITREDTIPYVQRKIEERAASVQSRSEVMERCRDARLTGRSPRPIDRRPSDTTIGNRSSVSEDGS